MVILSPEESGLPEILDRMLDKGVIVDTRVKVRLRCASLLNIKATIMLSSFKTAEKIGLVFPEGINTNKQAWQALRSRQPCPNCGIESGSKDLKDVGCPWCGWNYRMKEG